MHRLATLTAVLALSACANQGDEGFSVLNNTAVVDTCTLTGDPGQPFIPHGEIFVGSPQGYLLHPLVQSRVSASGAGSGAAVDPSTRTIFLKAANIDLEIKAVTIEHADHTFANPAVTLPAAMAKQSALFSAALLPAASVNVSFEAIPVQVIRAIETAVNPAADDRWRAEVLATVTIIGDLNGDDMSAQPFTFPVTVCNDCVVNNLGTCPTTAMPRTGNACNPYQDGIIDCCEDAEGFLTCPATTATAAN
jgi:hypothetical protein